MPLHRVDVEPLDPLLFGDNRSARAGIDHLLLDQDPSPLTFHGALGKLIWDRAGRWPSDVLGERQEDVLAPSGRMAQLLGVCARTGGGALLFPRPEHLRCGVTLGGRPRVLELLSPGPGRYETSLQSASPLVSAIEREDGGEDEIEAGVLLTEEALGEVLCGEAPATDAGLWLETDLVRPEPRPGIAVDERTATVVEGAFFSRPYRRYRPPDLDPRRTGAGYTAWFETLAAFDGGGESIGFLGGDRRRVRLRFAPGGDGAASVLAPLRLRVEEAAAGETAGVLLYLLTPAIAEAGPFALAGQPPVAYVAGDERQVSGWDARRRRPRPILSLVPAGSAFFYRWPEDADRAALVRRLWLQPVRELGGAVGFGRTLVGVWR